MAVRERRGWLLDHLGGLQQHRVRPKVSMIIPIWHQGTLIIPTRHQGTLGVPSALRNWRAVTICSGAIAGSVLKLSRSSSPVTK